MIRPNPGPPIHDRYNQAEYPAQAYHSRFTDMVQKIVAFRKKLNWGVTLEPVRTCTNPTGEGICAGVVPYHAVHQGDMGVFRVFAGYATQPVLEPYAAYTGEAFWRLQPFYSKPHPSGLSDYDRLASSGVFVGGSPGGG